MGQKEIIIGFGGDLGYRLHPETISLFVHYACLKIRSYFRETYL